MRPAQAQTVEQACQALGGGMTPVQQVACASQTAELRTVMAENFQLAGQIAARLDPAGLQQWKAQNLERQRASGIRCGIAPDRAPQLPPSPATEACLSANARSVNTEWRGWLAANGSAPVRQSQYANFGNPVAAGSNPPAAAPPPQRPFVALSYCPSGVTWAFAEMKHCIIQPDPPLQLPPPAYLPPQSCITQPNGSGWMTSCQ
jgi:hypothetical protein